MKRCFSKFILLISVPALVFFNACASKRGVSEETVQTMEPRLPAIFIAGNSTAKNGEANGWGDHLGQFFDAGKVTVENHAKAGRSSRTFITDGRWEEIRQALRPGDFVLIEFGHNDAGLINDTLRARGSFPTLGEETQEIDNQTTKKPETVHSFGWYMRKMIRESKAKGATPIVLSMTTRDMWPDGRIERENTFCTLSRQVAENEGVAFLDLRNIIADQYQLLGPIRVRQLFPKDHTHTNPEGAYLNAALVASGLKAMETPISTLFSPMGDSLSAYRPNRMVEPVMTWMTAPWMPEVQPKADSTHPTLYAIGNSTVRTGWLGNGENGQWGWGAPLGDFFDRERINVKNKALGGTSTRTFRSKGLWKPVLDSLKAGDYVIMGFGHNDASPVNDTSRARGTIKGNGEETQEIDNLLTGEHEVVHSYGWYLRQFIRETRSKGAIPIVCSPIPRNSWPDGKVNRTLGGYAIWAREAAEQEGAFFINLNERICDHYDAVGQDRVATLYFNEGDNTHTNAVGAQINATRLTEGIKALDDCQLKQYLIVVEPH